MLCSHKGNCLSKNNCDKSLLESSKAIDQEVKTSTLSGRRNEIMKENSRGFELSTRTVETAKVIIFEINKLCDCVFTQKELVFNFELELRKVFCNCYKCNGWF